MQYQAYLVTSAYSDLKRYHRHPNSHGATGPTTNRKQSPVNIDTGRFHSHDVEGHHMLDQLPLSPRSGDLGVYGTSFPSRRHPVVVESRTVHRRWRHPSLVVQRSQPTNGMRDSRCIVISRGIDTFAETDAPSHCDTFPAERPGPSDRRVSQVIDLDSCRNTF